MFANSGSSDHCSLNGDASGMNEDASDTVNSLQTTALPQNQWLSPVTWNNIQTQANRRPVQFRSTVHELLPDSNQSTPLETTVVDLFSSPPCDSNLSSHSDVLPLGTFLRCSFCKEECLDQDDLLSHLQGHTQQISYEADLFEKLCLEFPTALESTVVDLFSNPPCDSDLSSHLDVLPLGTFLQCSFCKEECLDQDDLLSHLQRHTQQISREADLFEKLCLEFQPSIQHPTEQADASGHNTGGSGIFLEYEQPAYRYERDSISQSLTSSCRQRLITSCVSEDSPLPGFRDLANEFVFENHNVDCSSTQAVQRAFFVSNSFADHFHWNDDAGMGGSQPPHLDEQAQASTPQRDPWTSSLLSSERHVLIQDSSESFQHTTHKTKAFDMGMSLNNINGTQVVCGETLASCFQERATSPGDAATLMPALDTPALSDNVETLSATDSGERVHKRIICIEIPTLGRYSEIRVHNAENSDSTASPVEEKNGPSEMPIESLLFTPYFCTGPALEDSENLAPSSHLQRSRRAELTEVVNLDNSLENPAASPQDTTSEPEAVKIVKTEEASPSLARRTWPNLRHSTARANSVNNGTAQRTNCARTSAAKKSSRSGGDGRSHSARSSAIDARRPRSSPCPVCDKILSSKASLERHLDRLHTGYARLRCAYCHKSFAREQSLDDHVRTHTGEPPVPKGLRTEFSVVAARPLAHQEREMRRRLLPKSLPHEAQPGTSRPRSH